MVRFANELDILQLAVLAQKYSEEVKNHNLFKFDIDYAIKNVSMSMTSPLNYLSVVVIQGEIKGFLWAIATTIPWSTSIVVFDNILYMSPESRGSYNVISLIKHYESWCKSIGAVCCSLSTASGIGTERTCALYERMGYIPVGYQFRKEL